MLDHMTVQDAQGLLGKDVRLETGTDAICRLYFADAYRGEVGTRSRGGDRCMSYSAFAKLQYLTYLARQPPLHVDPPAKASWFKKLIGRMRGLTYY
jgi:hypothetical protein